MFMTQLLTDNCHSKGNLLGSRSDLMERGPADRLKEVEEGAEWGWNTDDQSVRH